MMISYMLSAVHEFEKYISFHTRELVVLIILFFLVSVLSGEKMNVRFLALYLIVIIYMTILSRAAGKRRLSLRPFSCYQYFFTNDYLRRQILNNILLFVPLGIILSQVRPKWNTVCFLPCISLAIEILQYVTATGLFEVDDLISNSLGGLIGFISGMFWIFTVYLIKKLLQSCIHRKNEWGSKAQKKTER